MTLLHHDRLTADASEPVSWMLVLHGIYGAGRNWASVARRLVRERPEWGAVPVDLRGHGRSPTLEPPHTLEACARDLDALVEARSIEARAILGHSFGGKVALVWARPRSGGGPGPGRSPQRVWVVDASPGVREPEGSAWRMLEVLRASPGPFATRAHALAAIEAGGFARPVAEWMSTNLDRAEDGALRWRLDLDLMEALLLDFFREDAWDVVEDPPEGCEIHVVKATESSVLDEASCRRIEAAGTRTGRVRLHRVEGGHWLNADNPDALEHLLVEGMP
jgi:pimeloyl-ACP methyl ester carboxylesterase